jgi:hypothetical protein
MITKFLRRRNVDVNLPFSKNFSRIQIHASGDQTFKFVKKQNAAPPTIGLLLTEASSYLNTELGQRIVVE